MVAEIGAIRVCLPVFKMRIGIRKGLQPVILATWEAEARGSKVEGQPGHLLSLSQNTNIKRAREDTGHSG